MRNTLFNSICMWHKTRQVSIITASAPKELKSCETEKVNDPHRECNKSDPSPPPPPPPPERSQTMNKAKPARPFFYTATSINHARRYCFYGNAFLARLSPARKLSLCQYTSLYRYAHKWSRISQQTRDVDPMLVWCWSGVEDGGPTLNQHCFNVSTDMRMVKV